MILSMAKWLAGEVPLVLVASCSSRMAPDRNTLFDMSLNKGVRECARCGEWARDGWSGDASPGKFVVVSEYDNLLKTPLPGIKKAS